MRESLHGRPRVRPPIAIVLAAIPALLLAMTLFPLAAAAAPAGPARNGHPPAGNRPGNRLSPQASGESVTDFDAFEKPFMGIDFTGTWAAEYYAGAHGGQLYAGSGNDENGENDYASVKVRFRGRNVRLVSARYWQCGWCEVFLDGRSQGTFNLYYDNTDSYEPDWDYVLFEANGLRPGMHTLEVVNLGIPGSEDAIAQEYDLHFINVDYMVIW